MTVALLTTVVSWGLLAIGRTSLIALIAGVVLLDLGFQAAHINHQRAIYSLRDEAHSRINAAYMVAFFCGGAGGALLATTIYGEGGWLPDCALGGALALAAVVIWLAGGRQWSISTSP